MTIEKHNCWEDQNCGRGPGGTNIVALGECPAASSVEHHEVNDGLNAGRYCWRVAGTFCGNQVQGDMASKIMNCIDCDFFKKVKAEEGLIFRV